MPLIFLVFIFVSVSLILWRINTRKFISSGTVATAYDSWTEDKLLERLWGEHIHLGFYLPDQDNTDFRQAKVNFVHELVRWSGLDRLPKGSRILDVGCGIGGSSRILAKSVSYTHLTLPTTPYV